MIRSYFDLCSQFQFCFSVYDANIQMDTNDANDLTNDTNRLSFVLFVVFVSFAHIRIFASLYYFFNISNIVLQKNSRPENIHLHLRFGEVCYLANSLV